MNQTKDKRSTSSFVITNNNYNDFNGDCSFVVVRTFCCLSFRFSKFFRFVFFFLFVCSVEQNKWWKIRLLKSDFFFFTFAITFCGVFKCVGACRLNVVTLAGARPFVIHLFYSHIISIRISRRLNCAFRISDCHQLKYLQIRLPDESDYVCMCIRMQIYDVELLFRLNNMAFFVRFNQMNRRKSTNIFLDFHVNRILASQNKSLQRLSSELLTSNKWLSLCKNSSVPFWRNIYRIVLKAFVIDIHME